MSIEDVGTANHVHDDKSVSTVTISTIESDHGEGCWATLTESWTGNHVSIHSIEQWEQVDAFVRKAFDGMA